MTRYPLRRSLTALLAVGAFAVMGAAEASAQVPPLPSEVPFPTQEPTEDPVPEPDPEPTGEPEPSPTPSDQPTGGSSPTPEPSPDVADQPSDGATDPSGEPSDAPSGGQGSLPGFEVFTPEAGQGGEQAPGQAPQVAPGKGSSGGTVTVTDPDGTVRVVSAGVAPLAAALPGTYGIGLLAALLGVATIFGTFTLTQRGLLLATDAHGGTDVDTTRRWRTTAGVTLLAAAALVGIIGYVKISVETLVPVQVVYMASAGFGVIILAAAGGAMLISEQLRSDEKRLTEIESALATIAGHLAPAVSDAPRLLDRSAAPADAQAETADEDDATDEVAPKKRAAPKKTTAKKSAKKTPAKKRTAAKK